MKGIPGLGLAAGVIGVVLFAGGAWLLNESHFLLRDDYKAGYEVGQNHEAYGKKQLSALCKELMDERYGIDHPDSDAVAAFELGCEDNINGIDRDYARLHALDE